MKRCLSLLLAGSFVLGLAGLPQVMQAQVQPDPASELEAIRKRIEELRKQEERLAKEMAQAKVAEAERDMQYFKVEARGMLNMRKKHVPPRPGQPFATTEDAWLLSIRNTRFELTVDEKDKHLMEQCEKLKGQPVVVRGVLREVGRQFPPPGIPGTIGPAHGVIQLQSIEPAPVVPKGPDPKVVPPPPKKDAPPPPDIKDVPVPPKKDAPLPPKKKTVPPPPDDVPQPPLPNPGA